MRNALSAFLNHPFRTRLHGFCVSWGFRYFLLTQAQNRDCWIKYVTVKKSLVKKQIPGEHQNNLKELVKVDLVSNMILHTGGEVEMKMEVKKKTKLLKK